MPFRTDLFISYVARWEVEVLELLKRHAASPIIKANLKLVKDTSASEHVKTDSKPLRGGKLGTDSNTRKRGMVASATGWVCTLCTGSV
jgi:hypothetical protein